MQHLNPIIGKEIEGIRETPKSKEINLPFQLFSSIWGVTTGGLLYQGLTDANWSARFVPLYLALNWVIFPFKLFMGSNRQEMNFNKFKQISFNELNKIISVSSVLSLLYLFEFNPPNKTIILIGLVALNLLSCYGLHKNVSCQFSLIESSSKILNQIVNTTTSYDQETLSAELKIQIDSLIRQNREVEKQLQKIKTFMEDDLDLINAFTYCFQQSKSILLPPPPYEQSSSVQNPLVEEWRQEMQKQHYLNQMQTRIRDFLEKNPNFTLILLKKMSTAGQRDNNISKLLNI